MCLKLHLALDNPLPSRRGYDLNKGTARETGEEGMMIEGLAEEEGQEQEEGGTRRGGQAEEEGQ